MPTGYHVGPVRSGETAEAQRTELSGEAGKEGSQHRRSPGLSPMEAKKQARGQFLVDPGKRPSRRWTRVAGKVWDGLR